MPRSLIYLVDASIDVTGGFICARNEAVALRDFADVVLVLPKGSRIPADQLAPFTRVVYLPIVNLRKSLKAATLYLPALLWCSWRLARNMKAHGATVLQLNDFYLMHGAGCRLFGFRGRVLTWVRFDPRRFGALLSNTWLTLAVRSSDQLVAVSRFIRDILAPRYPSVVVYDALPESDGPRMNARDEDKGRRRIVYVGNYIEGKGQDDAIAAFAKVAAECPDLVLEFYGGDMGLEKNLRYRERLVQMAAGLGLEDRVTFGGFVEDTRRVLQGAYLALNCSHSESFSMTVLEAAAAGLPVIATKSGGPQEIVEDGVTGYLVGVRDIDAIAATVVRLAEDGAAAADMGRKGRVAAKERFSTKRFISKVQTLIGN